MINIKCKEEDVGERDVEMERLTVYKGLQERS